MTAQAGIITMCLGGGVACSMAEETAFSQAPSNNIVSIAAAGSSGNTDLSYPASYASVVSVAAVDEDGVVAEFSSYT
jgi:subtilisin family serine protease